MGRTRAATGAQAGGSGDGGERFRCWAGFRLVLTRTGIDAMCKAYKKGRRKRRDAGEDEAETSADESRADPGTGEPEQTASAAEGTLGRGTRRAATSTDYGGPVARRRRAEKKNCSCYEKGSYCSGDTRDSGLIPHKTSPHSLLSYDTTLRPWARFPFDSPQAPNCFAARC